MMDDIILNIHDTNTKKESEYHKYQYLFGQDVEITEEIWIFLSHSVSPLAPVRSDFSR